MTFENEGLIMIHIPLNVDTVPATKHESCNLTQISLVG